MTKVSKDFEKIINETELLSLVNTTRIAPLYQYYAKFKKMYGLDPFKNIQGLAKYINNQHAKKLKQYK